MIQRLLSAILVVALGSNSAWAQLVATSELYGEGVHRYFARDYQNAEQLLSQAIDSGSQDPRAYYFRGLARESFGGGGEIDFEEGARLEAAGRSGPQIGLALVRVQGHVRAKLEKARREARLQAAQQKALMDQAAPPATIPNGVTPPIPTPVPSVEASDPFNGEGTRSQEAQPAQPVAPTPDATKDPFGDEPEPAMDNDPFGGESTPAPSGADDLFGGESAPAAGAGDDPFAAPTAPAADATDPFSSPAPAEIEDPFK